MRPMESLVRLVGTPVMIRDSLLGHLRIVFPPGLLIRPTLSKVAPNRFALINRRKYLRLNVFIPRQGKGLTAGATGSTLWRLKRSSVPRGFTAGRPKTLLDLTNTGADKLRNASYVPGVLG